MGKKVYNAKARQNPKTIIDNTALKNLKLELAELGEDNTGGYDDSNALVLPSQKRATKIKVEHKQNVKILTKKQRKRLQAIVDKKKKKEGMEVNQLVRKLRRTFPYKKKEDAEIKTTINENAKGTEETVCQDTEKCDTDDEFDMKKAIRNVKKSKKKFLSQLALPKINLDDYKLPGDDTEADLLENQDSDSENNQQEDDLDNEDEIDLMKMRRHLRQKQPLWFCLCIPTIN
ncbi:Probable ATP-dependent RNA helicase kurz [Eumeta japonica]|uniref:Probable ATP-dependent RNA helicase kurz n=1 Tax=Eumeta variegata TaxID=151549 RepID=A0A4C1TEZ7_EUMVA|nr:Probable ATP-dependent RNA helicase kurz [Eumeta japonica]